MDDMTLDQAVAAVKRVAAANNPPEITPTPWPVELADGLSVIHASLDGNQAAQDALSDMVQALQAHMDVTWYLARWHDHQVGGVGTEFAAEYARRWLQLMAAYRVAMEL